MTAFYNEIDPYAAQWLRNLISAGHIAPGVVDERPIQEIEAFELAGFTQCHFFAGIGIWSHALRRADWPDERPIWTGSCPCQPFSAAGKQKGFSDARHLWPYWKYLIDQCRPAIVIGEQVASALDWLDLVSTDLEGAGYAFGASDLCAAGFGGAHIRQRLYFVGLADAERIERERRRAGQEIFAPGSVERIERLRDVEWLGDASFTASERDAGSVFGAQAPVNGARLGEHGNMFKRLEHASPSMDGLADDAGSGRREKCADLGGLSIRDSEERRAAGFEPSGGDMRSSAPMLGRNVADWLFCRDGKWRPVEPGTFPLAHAAPARVGRLRAYGNGLDAETATQFCEAVADIAGF